LQIARNFWRGGKITGVRGRLILKWYYKKGIDLICCLERQLPVLLLVPERKRGTFIVVVVVVVGLLLLLLLLLVCCFVVCLFVNFSPTGYIF
jgi:hypothetical protein